MATNSVPKGPLFSRAQTMTTISTTCSNVDAYMLAGGNTNGRSQQGATAHTRSVRGADGTLGPPCVAMLRP